MKFSIKTILGGFMVLALFSGCTKDTTPALETPTPEKTMILINSAVTDQGGMEVSVYAKDSLTASYNNLFFKVKDTETGNVISNAQITINPMMDMGTMIHSAPAENPVSNTATDGMFKGAVVFTMPAEMGWSLNVNVYDVAGDRTGLATIPVKVKAPAEPRTRVIIPADGSESLVISYLQPLDPKIGINDMEITIHKEMSMMDFSPMNNYTVQMDPEMVAMGHSSPNNVDPVATEMGHYKGQVNFTMSGNWRINLRLMDGQTVVDSTTYFDVTF